LDPESDKRKLEMKKDIVKYATDDITTLIVTVRGKRVILDRDLAALYGVPTFRFNEAVKRNCNRFPGLGSGISNRVCALYDSVLRLAPHALR
jgi:hypothetical protein